MMSLYAYRMHFSGEREKDDGVKLERWNRLQRTEVRRGKKDEREDRKWGPKSLMNLRSNLTGRLSMNRWWCVLS